MFDIHLFIYSYNIYLYSVWMFTSRVNDRSIFAIVAVFILHGVLHKLYADAIASHKVHTLLDLKQVESWRLDSDDQAQGP